MRSPSCARRWAWARHCGIARLRAASSAESLNMAAIGWSSRMKPNSRIAIVGAGPSGLYLALLMKKRVPSLAITVYEQNPENATYGFGIVLADRGMHRLYAADAPSAAAIERASFVSRHRVIQHNSTPIFID